MKKKMMLMAMIAILLFGLLLTACSDDRENTNAKSQFEGKLLILQAYGSAEDAAGATHSFVELYNITDEAIDLNGVSLYYAAGNRKNDSELVEGKDKPWNITKLNGTMPAHGSFLIMGLKQNEISAGTVGAARYQIPDDYGDIIDPYFVLSNRSFKAAIIEGDRNLTVQNPFNIDGAGTKVKGYIDMVGAINAKPNETQSNNYDIINGYETAPARCSASEAVRRNSLVDTNNNQGKSSEFPNGTGDFDSLRYASGGMSDALLEIRRPRNSGAGSWEAFQEPEEPPETEGLMIFQVFGTPTTNDSAPTHNFIELYNNSNAPINVSGFSVHYADGISSAQSTVSPWTRINLTGSIPAKGSYLILGKQMVNAATIADTSTNGNLDLTGITADRSAPAFVMSNRSYKIALMSNQADITVANPWGDAACIDLTSAINSSGADSIDAAKGDADLAAVNSASGGARTISKQKSWRRSSLTLSGVTLTDFTSRQYSSLSVDDIAQFRPRSAANGSWMPEF